MRVPLGPITAIPEDACVAVGDGTAVVLRVGDQVCAYRNRCIHQDSPLAGGIVRDGVLSCPLHFWRYRAASGELIGTRRRLESFGVEIVDGEAVLELPDPPAPMSLRDQLLARARGYDRAAAYDADRRGDPQDGVQLATRPTD